MIRILEMGIWGSILILFVLLFRILLRKRSKLYSYMLWMLVLIRLLCPFSLESSISLQPELKGKTAAVPMVSTAWIEKSSQPAEAENNFSETETGDGVTVPAAQKAGALLLIWHCGMFAVSGYFLRQYIRIRRITSSAIHGEDNIWWCDEIESPFVTGVFWPKIYLPYGISEENISYVLQHEKMHIRHKDALICLAGLAALCLHWWNPLVWYAVTIMKRDMEFFCDEAVLNANHGKCRKEYAAALLNFGMKRSGYKAALFFGESHTEQRIIHILHTSVINHETVLRALVLTLLMSALFLTIPQSSIRVSGMFADGYERNGRIEGIDKIRQLKTDDTTDEMEHICGISETEYRTFLSEFQENLMRDNRKKIAEMLFYPQIYTDGSKDITICGSEEFLTYYDKIFTEEQTNNITKWSSEEVQYNWQGIFLGAGNIWMQSLNGQIYITAVRGENASVEWKPVDSMQ